VDFDTARRTWFRVDQVGRSPAGRALLPKHNILPILKQNLEFSFAARHYLCILTFMEAVAGW